jgi:molybdopterin synthase sulfur carrier subunit
MKIKVKFFGALKEIFGTHERDIKLDGSADVKSLLDSLCHSKKCRQNVFDSSGNLKTGIQILKNRLPIQSFNGTDTALEEGDAISIIPPMFAG